MLQGLGFRCLDHADRAHVGFGRLAVGQVDGDVRPGLRRVALTPAKPGFGEVDHRHDVAVASRVQQVVGQLVTQGSEPPAERFVHLGIGLADHVERLDVDAEPLGNGALVLPFGSHTGGRCSKPGHGTCGTGQRRRPCRRRRI